MKKAAQEMKMYQHKFGRNHISYELFIDIFKNEEVSDTFLAEYGRYRFYDENDEYTEGYETAFSLFFHYTPLTIEKIDKCLGWPSSSDMVDNESFTEEMALYLLKEKRSFLDPIWIRHLSAHDVLSDESVKENLHLLNLAVIVDERYKISAGLVDFLITEGYVSSFKEFNGRSLSGVTVDFIEKYQKDINVYQLSATLREEKEVAQYLIDTYPEEVAWYHIFEVITPTLAIVKENWPQITLDSSPGLMIANYGPLEKELIQFVLMNAEDFAFEDLDWHEISRHHVTDVQLFSKHYERIKIKKVLENENLSDSDREEIETYQKLKTLFS